MVSHSTGLMRGKISRGRQNPPGYGKMVKTNKLKAMKYMYFHKYCSQLASWVSRLALDSLFNVPHFPEVVETKSGIEL